MDDKDVVAAEAKPTPTAHEKAGLKAPEWLGRPLAHKDHAADLERDAAVNEFGHKMNRAEAEEKAHSDYVQRQHTEAAAHHLSGLKAAHGAGDMESARKHSLMYELHSKALGHKPVGPAHPSVTEYLEKHPGKVKFRAHRGDLFAIDQKPKTEGVDKAEALHAVWKALEPLAKGDVVKFPGNKIPAEDKGKEADVESMKRWALDRGRVSGKQKKGDDLNKWAKAELVSRKESSKPKVVPCVCESYNFPHRHKSGRCGAK